MRGLGRVRYGGQTSGKDKVDRDRLRVSTEFCDEDTVEKSVRTETETFRLR